MKIKFLAMAAIAAMTTISFTSCSNDDDASANAQKASALYSDGKIGYNVTQDGVIGTRANSSTITMSWDYASEMIYYRIITNVHGEQITGFLYFSK